MMQRVLLLPLFLLSQFVRETPGDLVVIEARFGAVSGWHDVTASLRTHIENGRIDLPSLKPVLNGLPDPSFGNHKQLVVVYRAGGTVQTKIVATEGGDGAWGSLQLPEKNVPSASAGSKILVAGELSDNIIQIDPSSGEATVICKLAAGSRPWSLAVAPDDRIFVGLRGKGRNIVRLERSAASRVFQPVDLTGSVGRFGPGLMAFDRRGLLNVSADTHREVRRYAPEDGKLVDSMKLRAANPVGLTLHNGKAYAAEYFQKAILEFDLQADPPSGRKLIYKSDRLDRPHGMTVGHNGNLFVSSLNHSMVHEFDIQTGEFHKTLIDVKTVGGSSVKDVHYDAVPGDFLLTTGNAVYQISPDGSLRNRFEPAALRGAVAVTTVAAAPTATTGRQDPAHLEFSAGQRRSRGTEFLFRSFTGSVRRSIRKLWRESSPRRARSLRA